MVIDEPTYAAELAAKDVRAERIAAREAAARAEVESARVRPNPSISLEREEPFVDGSGLPTNYLRITLPFDLSGRRGLAIEGAETTVRAVASEATRDRFELVIAGLRAFDDAALSRLRVEILVSTRESLVRAVEIARQRGKAGDASGYQVQRFELALAAHDDELASARIELARNRAELAALVGRSGEVDAASTLELPASAPDVDALLAQAGRRDDLRAAKLRGDAASQQATAAGRGWVPTPSLMGGAIMTDLGDQTATGYVAGLSLSIPIFDAGGADRARARAERQSAVAQERVLQRQIPSAVRLAHATYAARIEQARVLAAGQLDRLDVLLGAAETAFREGGASVVELLDAHQSARTIRLRALELRHQVMRDKRELELAVGKRL